MPLEHAARVGRPSRYPVIRRYNEDTAVSGALDAFAEHGRLSGAEAQRVVNRVGLKALGFDLAA